MHDQPPWTIRCSAASWPRLPTCTHQHAHIKRHSMDTCVDISGQSISSKGVVTCAGVNGCWLGLHVTLEKLN